jgi:hypothetical protein
MGGRYKPEAGLVLKQLYERPVLGQLHARVTIFVWASSIPGTH